MAMATYSEAFKEYAHNYGMDHPDVCWVCTPWDTWERNPFYHGPPVPHPEADYEEEDEVGPARTIDEEEIPF